MNTKMVMAGCAAVAMVLIPFAAAAAALGPPALPGKTTGADKPPAEKSSADATPADERSASDCSPEQISMAMRDLFPPAPESVRVKSARTLEECRPPGGDGVLSAALTLSTETHTAWYTGRALATYRTPVAIAALRTLARSTRPVAVRAVALPALVQAGASDEVAAIVGNVREFDWLRTEALRALVQGGRPPDERYLTWLRGHSGPLLDRATRELLSPQATIARAAAPSGPTPTAAGPDDASAPAAIAPAATPRASDQAGSAPQQQAPEPPPAQAGPTGPRDGTAVAVAASTVAGAALMLDLSLLGVQDATPQLLLGTAGAVIGFGTSWALSRFGVRPTIEQATWFANATAWGTLAGITIYGGSGADNYKLKYGSLVIGEMAGMAAGVWSARRWSWTGPQIVLADSLFLGTAMVGFGMNRLRYETPRITPTVAIGVVPAMLASAIAGRMLTPSRNDLALMATSALAGAWLGSLASSGLAEGELASRWGQGGMLMGAGLGYLGGAAAGAFTEVNPLRLKVGAGGIVAGSLMGLGLHLVERGVARNDSGEVSDSDYNRLKLGTSLGGLVVGAAAFAAAPHLKLGPAAAPMTVWGGVYGAGTMWLASAATYHDQPLTAATDAILYGSMLATGVAGAATGLVLSGRSNPDAADQWTTFAATAAATSAGWGATTLLTDGAGLATGAGVLGGAALGLAGGAMYTRGHRLRAPSVGAGALGSAYGSIAGALAPTLAQSEWMSNRRSGGSAALGAGTGAVLGAAVGQLTGATARDVTVTAMGTTVGFTAGLGAGRMWPSDDSRPERIGMLAGMTTLGAATALLMRPLRLHEPLPSGSTEVIATGTALGIANGLWTAALLDPSGELGQVPVERIQGAVLFGASLGFATGAALAPRLHGKGGLALLWGATAAGTAMGRGAALLLADQPGRTDAAGALAGSLAGTAGGMLALSALDPDSTDAGATIAGAGYGAMLGALTPSLGDSAWPGWNRRSTGGALFGAGAGAVGGLALRRALHGDARAVGLTALGGADGAATGLGWGLLLGGGRAGEPVDTQALRIGVVAGTTAGLGLGMASWSRLTLGSGDLMLISAATVLAGANAAMLPTLGHASASDWNQRRMSGGFLAGAGTASFGATLLAPLVEVDGDLVANALAMDGLFTGAGAGVGALISDRDDAPVAGMLVGGTAGLLLGGGLHRRIELDAGDSPILVTGAVEGLWMGAWMPYVLREPAAITQGQRNGGVAAGLFGGLGLAVLANTAFAPRAGDAGFAALGSGIGAGIGGGLALLSTDLADQGAVGLMLGGTGGGLLVGGLLAPRLTIDQRVAGSAAVGGLLGASEALLFTWSSRANGRDDYLGAGLLGASVGTGLGIANGVAIGVDSNGRLPALAGFTAWGAWMGSLSGSLVARDPHEITAGGLIGSNVGLLAGYGLLRSGAIQSSDFGWLSLFGAVGTAAGAGVGAPFASRGEPTPILAGMAAGPAVGMMVGAFVLPRIRASAGTSSPTVAFRNAVTRAFPLRSRADARPLTTSNGGPELSSTVARDLETRHRFRRALARAVDASVKIADCAPMIGALPGAMPGTMPGAMPGAMPGTMPGALQGPDATGATNGSTTPPVMVGLVGHWH